MKQLLPIIAALLLTMPLSAKIWTVQVANFSFTPSSLPTVTVGDTVQWVWINGAHTTTSLTVPTGASSWNSPIETTTPLFNYKVTVEGVYTYQCTPHAPNMAGTFTVQKATGVPSVNASALLSFGPNPATSNLHITIPVQFNSGLIQIIDPLGRMVRSVTTNSQDAFDIATSGLANGMYIIRASGDGKSFSSLFEVRH